MILILFLGIRYHMAPLCVQGFRTPLWLRLRLFPVQRRLHFWDGGKLFLLGLCLVGLLRGYHECVVHHHASRGRSGVQLH